MNQFGPRAEQFFLNHPEWLPVIPSICPLGWDDILTLALIELWELEFARGKRFSITQIKQKWAQLRIYVSVEGEPTEFTADVHTQSGLMSMRTRNAGPGSVTEEAMAIIDRATEQSGYTCELCGEAGVVRGGSWHRVLCDRHAAIQAGG